MAYSPRRHGYAGLTGCWTYDSFGNRTGDYLSPSGTSPCAVNANTQSTLATFSQSSNNHLSRFV